MRFAAWLATAVLIVSAIVGMVVAIMGNVELAELIWIAGPVGAVSIAFGAPWLIHLFGDPGTTGPPE